VTRKAKAAGFDSWVSYIRNRTNWALTRSCRRWALKTVSPITPDLGHGAQSVLLGRGHGRQSASLHRSAGDEPGGEPEVLNLRAVAGEYDLQERHISLSKLRSSSKIRKRATTACAWTRPERRRRGDAGEHRVRGRPEVSKWLKNRDFRRPCPWGWTAIRSTRRSGSGSERPAPPRRRRCGHQSWQGVPQKWAALDIKQANALLDRSV